MKHIFLFLLLATPYLPGLGAIDVIGSQWLYLSIVNFTSLAYFIFIRRENIYGELLKIKYLIYFLFFSLISIIVSDNLPESIITLSNYFQLILLLLNFSLISRHKSKFKFPIKYIVVILFIVELVEPGFVFLEDLMSDNLIFGDKRYYGNSGNVNIAAFALLIKLPIVIYFLKSRSRINFILVFIYILSTGLILILGTRAVLYFYILMIVFISVYEIFIQKYKRLMFYIVLILPILILPNILSLQTKDFNQKFIENAKSITDEKDSSLVLRMQFYEDAIYTIIKNPLIGIGIGNWKLESIKLQKEEIKNYRVSYHVHNDFLQIAAESGIFASIFYFLFFTTSLLSNIKVYLKNSNSFIIYMMILPLLIFMVDSSINFPIARPLSVVFILFLIAFNDNQISHEIP